MKPRQMPEMEPPLTGVLVRTTAVALAGALLMLVPAAMHAEDGIDPLKTGKESGRTELAQAKPAAHVAAGAFTPQPRNYKVDSEDFTLRPGEGVELKYHMEKGAVMVYGWKANGKLRFEFHGEPDQKPNKDYYESYELDDQVGKEQRYGSFTAPTTGIHGWFWENKGDKEVEMHLTTAGFYDSAKMYAGGPPEEIPIEDPK